MPSATAAAPRPYASVRALSGGSTRKAENTHPPPHGTGRLAGDTRRPSSAIGKGISGNPTPQKASPQSRPASCKRAYPAGKKPSAGRPNAASAAAAPCVAAASSSSRSSGASNQASFTRWSAGRRGPVAQTMQRGGQPLFAYDIPTSRICRRSRPISRVAPF